jgi:integrase
MIKMAMNAEKVVKLQTENNVVHHYIEMFLKRMSLESKKTEVAYRRAIRDFFLITKNKEITHLTIEDIQVTLSDFDYYTATMRDSDEGYANGTINQRNQAVIALLRYLHATKINKQPLVEDISYIEAKQVKRLKDNPEEHGICSVEEVWQIANWILENEVKKKQIKYYLVLFALDTCIRKSALLEMKWTDFRVEEDGVLVKVVDKGNKEKRTKISKDFYEKLLSIKGEGKKVFDIDNRSITRMWSRMKEDPQMSFMIERNIVFHSIRKSGVSFRFRVTGGDIMEAKRAANHSNLNTTQRYVNTEDYGIIGAVSGNTENDLKLIDEVSHEELLDTIKGMNKDFQLILAMKLKGKCQNRSINAK